MFLGGVTFVLFYRMLTGNLRELFENTELRWYISLLLLFCGATALSLWNNGTYPDFLSSLRFGTFQIVSLLTTTGYTTADYELWPQSAQMFLYTVCFIGACAGSTTSGIKIVHYTLICKYMYAAIKKIYVGGSSPVPTLVKDLKKRGVARP